MDFEKWKELIDIIFKDLLILVFVIAAVVTFSQLLVNGAYANKIIDAYKELGQILPFS